MRHVELRDETGNIIRLHEFPARFGRDESADVMLTNVLASRRHCEIACVDDRYYLSDLGSVNGTLLNGETLSSTTDGPTELQVGDEIVIGSSVFLVNRFGDSVAEFEFQHTDQGPHWSERIIGLLRLRQKQSTV